MAEAVAASVNTALSIAKIVSDLVKRFHQQQLNSIQWKQLSTDCATASRHLENVSKYTERIKGEIHRDQFKYHIDLTTSRLEDSEKQLNSLESRASNTQSSESETVSVSTSASSSSQNGTVNFLREKWKNGKRMFQSHGKTVKDSTKVQRDKAVLDELTANVKDAIAFLIEAAKIAAMYEPPTFEKYFYNPSLPSNYSLKFQLPIDEDRNATISHECLVKKKLVEYVKTNHNLEQVSKSGFTLGVWGQGGMGKSVALQALCSEDEVQKCFPHGIHFLCLGENATPQILIEAFASCVGNAGFKDLKNEIRSEFNSETNPTALAEVAQKCSQIFESKRVLFIVDDVWDKESNQSDFLRFIQTLISQSDKGAILFSTREEQIAKKANSNVHFKYLNPVGSFAKDILKSHLHDRSNEIEDLSPRASDALHRLLELCGGLILCLAVAGSGLYQYIDSSFSNKRSIEEGLVDYTEMAENCSNMLSCENVAPEYSNLAGVAKSSLRQCERWARNNGLEDLCKGKITMIQKMFHSLCIVARQQVLPISIIQRLWGQQTDICIRVVEQFERTNLLNQIQDRGIGNNRLPRNNLRIKVHDRMIDVCIFLAQRNGGAEKWHRQLLVSFIQETSVPADTDKPNYRSWWKNDITKNRYIFENVGRHLVEGGLWRELFWLVSDVRWTLRRREENQWSALQRDFQYVIDAFEKKKGQSWEESLDLEHAKMYEDERSGIEIIRDMIFTSWREICVDSHTIEFGMYGRISQAQRKNKVVSNYLRTVGVHCPKPSLHPMTPVFLKKDSRQLLHFNLSGEVQGIYISPENEIIAISEDQSRLLISNLSTQHSKNLNMANLTCNCIAFCTKQQSIVFGCGTEGVQIKEAATDKLIRQLMTVSYQPVQCVAISEDGLRVASGSNDGTVKVWEVKTGIAVGRSMAGHDQWVTCLAFSRDGKHLVSGSRDKSVCVWKVDSGEMVGKPMTDHDGPVGCVSFSKDGRRVVSGSFDKKVRVWEVKTSTPVGKPMDGHQDRISCVNFSTDGSKVVSGADDKTVCVWNVETGELIGEPFIGHDHCVNNVMFSTDGRWIISGSRDKTVRIWKVGKGESSEQQITSHDDWIECVAFSECGTKIASGSHDTNIRIWDVKTGASKAIGNLTTGHKHWVECVTFSRDGRLLASASDDKTIQIWQMDTDDPITEPMLKLTGHEDVVKCISFSPDGKKIVSGSFDKKIRVWNTENGNPVGEPMTGHRDWVRCVNFSDDGQMIVSGSDDMTVRVWELNESYEFGFPRQGHQNWVQYVRFSMDKKRVISGSLDNTLRVWDVQSSEPLGCFLNIDTSKIHSTFENQFSPFNFATYQRWLQDLQIVLSEQGGVDHVCIVTLHREISRILEDIGYWTELSRLIVCSNPTCNTQQHESSPEQTLELCVTPSDVHVRIDLNKWIKLAEPNSWIAAVRNRVTVHGYKDGRLLISHLQI